MVLSTDFWDQNLWSRLGGIFPHPFVTSLSDPLNSESVYQCPRDLSKSDHHIKKKNAAFPRKKRKKNSQKENNKNSKKSIGDKYVRDTDRGEKFQRKKIG